MRRNRQLNQPPEAALPSARARKISGNLLTWFMQNARDLPWRRTQDPYAIWVSEVMLQQTQVKTVIPYWERWLKELPSIRDLAAADSTTIHRLWAGLGYYSRARNLQAAAREIVVHHEGRLPRSIGALLNLPGIGRYTAGAVASIAFNEPVPIVDGNVTRVLCRVLGIVEDPKKPPTAGLLWSTAERLVIEAGACSNFATIPRHSFINQAMMELGALICLPRHLAKCPECPLKTLCVARQTGRVADLPVNAARPTATKREFAAFIVKSGGRFVLRQRPEGTVNAHLWEFPNFEMPVGAETPSVAEVSHKLGIPVLNLEPLCTIKHTITRYRVTLKAYASTLESTPRRGNVKLVTASEIDQAALPSAHRKLWLHWRSTRLGADV